MTADPVPATPAGTTPTPAAPAHPRAHHAPAPGSVITVRDEDWLVTQVDTVHERASATDEHPTRTAHRITAQGLSELVRDTTAVFIDTIDTVHLRDPRNAPLINDRSPQYRDTRLWLESTLRKTDLPVTDQRLSVAAGMLIDPKNYQQTPVRKILSTDKLRPRLLIADAVGLGKTIEIGLILAELIKRGRGDRILIVTPKHVLEQMQQEMWTKFALPFVRLDSEGIRRIRQKLPATRNPFTYYKRAIISIDTLKSDRYLAHLRNHQWDAVVIDESHNVVNSGTLNNRLADTLAANTDALILASATPHNGRKEAFAELIRLLDPTAVRPDGTLDTAAVNELYVRRHRNSDEVAAEVGDEWAVRRPPQFVHVQASPEENALARELDEVWLHPRATAANPGAKAPTASGLFPWTLAKAFLSSPQALATSIANRRKTVESSQTPAAEAPSTPHTPTAGTSAAGTSDATTELAALDRLRSLTQAVIDAAEQARKSKKPQTGKYGALLTHLSETVGIGPKSDTRAVVFAERVQTLEALARDLPGDLGLKKDQVQILHGGLSDMEQQAIVEDFKTSGSRVRVLVTGDVASEGVNLHQQCHQLVHYDIPWSLIRIEQRNGRIDRYGQRTPPQITALVLEPESEAFAGDIRVLSRLIAKENEAHKVFGDAAALMGTFNADAEEKTVRKALMDGAGTREDLLDQVVPDADHAKVLDDDDLSDWFADIDFDDEDEDTPATNDTPAPTHTNQTDTPEPPRPGAAPTVHMDHATGLSLYGSPVDFLKDALIAEYQGQQSHAPDPTNPRAGGVSWKEWRDQGIAQLVPPSDLVRRLDDLPQTYRKERKIVELFKLATTQQVGRNMVEHARNDPDSPSLWPEAHFLGPLHPVLDWAADRTLAAVTEQARKQQAERGAIYAVRADVTCPIVGVHASLTNERGQTVTRTFSSLRFGAIETAQDLAETDDEDLMAFAQTHETVHAFLQDLGLDRAHQNTGALDTAALQRLVPVAVEAARDAVHPVFASATTHAQEQVETWMSRNAGWQQDAGNLINTAGNRRRTHEVSAEQALITAMAPAQTFVRPLVLVVPTHF
ncbi:helicase-related protein [Brevibacterium litoralis]|uniref:helicase-related protein n=1 Tax=Brevibacterium litoralis TaxID=3138935 RepID=UPI0032ECBADF